MKTHNARMSLRAAVLFPGQTHRRIRSALRRRLCVNPVVLAASLFTATSAGAADTLSVFHKFVGGNDVDDPNWLIQASDGNFYGTCHWARILAPTWLRMLMFQTWSTPWGLTRSSGSRF